MIRKKKVSTTQHSPNLVAAFSRDCQNCIAVLEDILNLLGYVHVDSGRNNLMCDDILLGYVHVDSGINSMMCDDFSRDC